MPAKDHYHDTVVRALIKAGWRIEGEQVRLDLPQRRLWIDIQARKEDRSLTILVEVKGFENMPSPVEYLAAAIGKYALYKAALHLLASDVPLYLAVPIQAYNGILDEPLGQQMVESLQVRLLVFDPEREEIILWSS